jgi:crotonobetainyl-CoA:carnitine CoA-transferase CaiB-like acyl-CoA transferase
VADADVVIENFKVGGLGSTGWTMPPARGEPPADLLLDHRLRAGRPYAQRAGYDFIIQGMSGLMSVTGPADGQPQKVGVAVTDIFTGVYRQRRSWPRWSSAGGRAKGQHIDMALLDVATSIMANQAMNYLASGKPPGLMGNAHPNLAPYAVFDCKDGWLILATGNDGQYQRLCGILGLAGMANAPEFLTNADRVANRAALTST